MAERRLPDTPDYFEVYDPATISEVRAAEIEESARRIIDQDDSLEVVLHEVIFLRNDVRRLRTRVNQLRVILLFIAIGIAAIGIRLWR